MRYTIKQLLDMNMNPFFPFMTSDAVFTNGTSNTVKDELDNRYTKPEIDLKFQALGTVMDFRGVVETEKQLPDATPQMAGDLYVVLHYKDSIISHSVICDGVTWVDMGEPLNLDDYYTKEAADMMMDSKIEARAQTERRITNDDIASALNQAKTYTNNTVTSAITASETKERNITNKAIADSLATAKSYTDTSITNLHVENFLTASIFAEDRSVTGTWTYNTGLKVIKVPSEDYDVVNKKYLEETVIGPLTKLVKRLNGEEV